MTSVKDRKKGYDERGNSSKVHRECMLILDMNMKMDGCNWSAIGRVCRIRNDGVMV